jgi:glycosyltransferase involved in cell wall biosynthesis
MHILRLTPHFYWPQLAACGWPVKFDAIGGMQTQIYRQTEALSELGVTQTVLTLKIPKAPEIWAMSERATICGVRIPVFPVRSKVRGMIDLNLSWFLGVFWYLFVNKKQDVDLIHVHCSGVFWPLLLGLVLCKILNKKLVLTIHCSILATYEAMNTLDKILLPFARWCERRALEKADHIIVLTPRLKKIFLDNGYVCTDRISVVPDTIDVEEFRSRATEEAIYKVWNTYSVPRDRKIIGYVGRIAHEKGWNRFVALAEKLKERKLHFLVCGDGNERDSLEKMIKAKNLESRFTITGYVPQSLIPAILTNINLFVLTSIHEEFGGSLIEAMAMTVPIAAFAVGGVPYVVSDGNTGLLVPDGDLNRLYSAVTQLLDDEHSARKLTKNALDDIRKKYDKKIVGHKIFKIYQEVCGEQT